MDTRDLMRELSARAHDHFFPTGRFTHTNKTVISEFIHAILLRIGEFNSYNRNSQKKMTDLFPSHLSSSLQPMLNESQYDSLWSKPETIGWLYQYFLEPGLDIFRTASSPKITPEKLAIRTQQFTPSWIADYLVQNTLGRFWLEMHPDSRLIESMSWYVPLKQGQSVKMCPVKQIRILDPACGAMHLGLPAVRLLELMYAEELDQAGKKGWPNRPSVSHPSKIASSIISNNLFAADIDEMVLSIAQASLFLYSQGRHKGEYHLLKADTLKLTYEKRMREKGFPSTFDILLLNPPYLDKRDYPPSMKSFMASHYPVSGRNLYTAFLERSIGFLKPGGRLGAITPQTFMFIQSYETLREFLLKQGHIETLVHTGLGTFEDAVVDCAYYTIRRRAENETTTNEPSIFFQLTGHISPEEKENQFSKMLADFRVNPQRALRNIYHYRDEFFSDLPGSPWVYWISPAIRKIFRTLPPLESIAELRQGLATTDNKRFIRYRWEIPSSEIGERCRNLDEAKSSGKKWFPYIKGGGYKKWFGFQEYLVNWHDDGTEIKKEITKRYPYLKGKWEWVAKNTNYYFREGVTYSYLTSRRFSARFAPAGSIFDVAGSCVFSNDPLIILGLLNSRWCRFALSLINHTVNFQIGDLQRLPVPHHFSSDTLRTLVQEAIDLSKKLESFEETSPDFQAPPPWEDGIEMLRRISRRLAEIQDQVDQKIYRLYGLSKSDIRLIERSVPPDDAPEIPDEKELAYRWVSYAVGLAFSRFSSSTSFNSNRHYIYSESTLQEHIENILECVCGKENCRQILSSLPCPISEYLQEHFFKKHLTHYLRRPVYWPVMLNKSFHIVCYSLMDSEAFKKLLTSHREVAFSFDDGVEVNIRRFSKILAIPSWKKL